MTNATTTDPADTPFDALTILQWYADSGVDIPVDESPRDFFEISRQQAARRAETRPAASAASTTGPNRPRFENRADTGSVAPRHTITPTISDRAIPPDRAEAAQIAAAATSLEALQIALDSFIACPLRKMATNTVFADGNPDSGIMIIGEAPGADEDRLGLPFVGVSGALLDAMLASIGLDRRTCYITNVVPWRPPGNRKPTPDELALCLPFLERHIALVAPRAILALGGLAAGTLLAKTEGITRLRGKWGMYAAPALPRPVPLMPTFHPAYLLRTPAQKRFAWRDLLAFRHRIETDPNSG